VVVPAGPPLRPVGPWARLTRPPSSAPGRRYRGGLVGEPDGDLAQPAAGVEPGASVPLRPPRRARLGALAILSGLIFVIGVGVASLLLLIIVAVTRALAGV
jgi:hypothetical protein